ncbi:MAG: AmmeMemoRadiSam system protein A [Coriobacteriia bacterium]|nr:AmmeMemoRadiSam system protein A [Coriobacteriia bacterium]
MTNGTFGLIVPHPPVFVPNVGGERARTAASSIEALAVAQSALDEFAPETLVLMSPHAPAAGDLLLVDDSDSFSGDLSQFGDATVYRAQGDPELATAILAELRAHGIDSASRSGDLRLRAGWLDHASIVPLSFIDPDARFRVVVLSLAYLPLSAHRVLGLAVREAADRLRRRVAFIASGDCSHRLTSDAPAGYSPRGIEFDEWLRDVVASGRLSLLAEADPGLQDAAGECGLRSFVALGGFAGSDPVPTSVLAYEGPWGVGYLTALVGDAALRSAADAPEAAAPAESEIVTLARTAIETYVRDGRVLAASPLVGAQFPARAGAFVSLHRNGDLRGCIGTIAPTSGSLAEEVVHNAIQAAMHDPRFPSLSAIELGDLDVKVDVLHEPEESRREDLDPARYGVIVSTGSRRGLLLPDLEGVDDVETQVGIALQKGGIRPEEQYRIERFRVDRYT